MLNLSFEILKIGGWTIGYFYLSVESQTYPLTSFPRYYEDGITSECALVTNNTNLIEFSYNIINHFDNNLKIHYNRGILTPIRYGVRAITLIAMLCDSRCLKCTGPNTDDCSICIANASLPNCSCNAGFYLISCGQSPVNACNDRCNSCLSPCDTCITTTACISCISGYYFINSNNTCVTKENCPSNYYIIEGPPALCQSCDSSCDRCKGSASTDCLSCVANGSFLDDGICTQKCSSHKYPDLIMKVCNDCHSDCFECYGSLNSNCISCSDSGKKIYEGSCVEICPNHTFSYNDICKDCDNSCETCNGTTSNDCTSCANNFSLYQGVCLDHCPLNTFMEANICELCDLSCLTCNSSAANNCLSCGDKKSFIENACVCSNGTFMSDGINYICSYCDITCLTCNGSSKNDCFSCKIDRTLDAELCKCIDGSYEDRLSFNCLPCDNMCKTCINDSKTCNSCTNDKHLVESECVCHNDQFLDNNILECISCDISCLTCHGQGKYNCSSCTDDKILNDNQECICPHATFYEQSTSLCKTCDDSCSECNEESNKDCLKCQSSSQSLAYGKCLDRCPNGYFNNILKLCEKCKINCEVCIDINSCEICFDGYVLNSENNCVNKKKIFSQVETIQNPIAFKIIFSEYWSYLMNNLSTLMIVSITNLPCNYSLKITNLHNTSLIILEYKTIKDNIYNLNITILGTKGDVNSEYYIDKQIFLISLDNYVNCETNQFYNSGNQYILFKLIILYIKSKEIM